MSKRPNVQLSQNFWLSELQCPCDVCDGGYPEVEFIVALQDFRDALGFAIVIDSGVRCEARNKAVGGEPGSWHLSGRAADIFVPSGVKFFKMVAEAPKFFRGMGFNHGTLHVDTRDTIPVAFTYYQYYQKKK